MTSQTVSRLQASTGGELLAPPGSHARDALVGPVTIDSRDEFSTGAVFWALPGKSTHGDRFVEHAWSRGAQGVVTSRRDLSPPAGHWAIVVDDTRRSLIEAARRRRQEFSGRVVGVTGSVGKTTTRQMIAAVLGAAKQGVTSPRNYNNEIGLPLSMLTLEPEHDFAVFELAARAPGQIASLAELARPHVGVLTAVGDAHLATFGSRLAIADAKAELLEALPKDGLAVVNGDDQQVLRVASRSPAPIVTFGRGGDCEVTATHVEYEAGRLAFRVDRQRMEVSIWGRHHLTSALAAVAVGRAWGLGDRDIAQGLQAFRGQERRCQSRCVGDIWLLDDSYNASPQSMRAALELLRETPARGQRIAVCGDMLELGDAAPAAHLRLGQEIVTVGGADRLFACGQFASEIIRGARLAGMPARAIEAIADPSHVADALAELASPGDAVLFKASRAVGLDAVVELLFALLSSRATPPAPSPRGERLIGQLA